MDRLNNILSLQAHDMQEGGTAKYWHAPVLLHKPRPQLTRIVERPLLQILCAPTPLLFSLQYR